MEGQFEPFQLGKYRVNAKVGRGGFGTVYRAEDSVLRREVAVKVLHPYLNAPDFIERFKGEARLAAGLQHPGVVTIFDMGESEGRTYLVMEYLPGGSLQERIAQGPLAFEQARQVLVEVCAALEELHSRGLVHRDLKPGNILFNASGQAVLTDFGLARSVAATSASSTQAGAGTPFYKAPEVWRGKPPAGPQADVYALGCILYEMLTGKILFYGDTPDEVITKHLVDGPDLSALPTEGVPQGVRELLERALALDPAQRWSSAAEFSSRLAGMGKKKVSDQPVAAWKAQKDENACKPPDDVQRMSQSCHQGTGLDQPVQFGWWMVVKWVLATLLPVIGIALFPPGLNTLIFLGLVISSIFLRRSMRKDNCACWFAALIGGYALAGGLSYLCEATLSDDAMFILTIPMGMFLAAGIMAIQGLVLRKKFTNLIKWILFSAIGVGFGILFIYLMQIQDPVKSIIIIPMDIYGIITGIGLSRLPRRTV